MQKYNKLTGSGIGGALGIIASALLIGIFNYLGVELTPELTGAIAIGGPWIGSMLGTYLAKANVY